MDFAHSRFPGVFLAMLALLAPALCALAQAQDAAHPALRMMPVPAGQGVNIHFYKGNEQDLSMLGEAGLGIVRMDLSWARCETAQGVYDFAAYDRLVADLEQRGIRLLFIIDYGNPLYDSGLSPHSDACREAYARFCAALAGRYAGKDVIWELWNEPNIGFWKPEPNVDDYMAWCHAVVPAIRKADPGACIIGPATSCIPRPFLEDCFERGLLTLVDGVSVHPYRSAKQGPETALPEYESLAALIERYKPAGKCIPIVSGEWGYSTTHLPDELQGKYLPRQWLANMMAGIPISIWYDWHDDGKDPDEKEHNFGTVTWDYQPKPAYLAIKTLTAQLAGYTPVGRLGAESGEVYILAFRNGSAYKLAVWRTGEPGDVAAPQGLTLTGAVNHLGEPLANPAAAWEGVDDGPRYITLGGDAPAWLQMMPVRFEAARNVTAGSDGGVTAAVSLRNPTARPVEVVLHPVAQERVAGAWTCPSPVTIAPEERKELVWRGTLARRDIEELSLPFAVTVKAEDGAGHRFGETLDLRVANPLLLRLLWRESGLGIRIESADATPIRGNIIVRVDGEIAASTPFPNAAPGDAQTVCFDDIDLEEAPLRVGLRLEDEAGHLVAALEPMTYQLVDAVKAPRDAEAGQYYRIWHEGDADRKAELTAAIAAAPGEHPPYPNALKVDYDMAPGWCFWQAGPKETAMPHPQPKRMLLWVHGDGASGRIRCRVADATGQTFQCDDGSIDFQGWRYVELSLEDPSGSWGGADDGVIHPPLHWVSYYLQDPARAASAGTTCLTGVVLAW